MNFSEEKKTNKWVQHGSVVGTFILVLHFNYG